MNSPGSSLADGFRLGDVEVSQTQNELRRAGRRTHIEPKAMDVLCALAERDGATASRDDLLDEVWGHVHGCDESLTRAVYLVRRAFQSLGAPPPILTVPKRGYRLCETASLARPPRIEDAPSNAGLPKAPFRAGPLAALTALAFVVLLFSAAWLRGSFSQAAPGASIDRVAVRPFGDLSGTAVTASLAGLLEDRLESRLAAAPGGVVVARDEDGSDTHVLEGSVLSAEDEVVVNVRLLAPGRRTLLWSTDYRRPAAHGGAIAEEVAWRTAAALSCARPLLSSAARPTRQLESLALQYCHLVPAYTYGQGLADRSAALLAAAPDDPALLGRHALTLTCSIALPEDRSAAAEPLARRALSLAPGQTQARLALALRDRQAETYAAREAAARAAYDIDPRNSCAAAYYVFFLRQVGRLEEAYELSAQHAADAVTAADIGGGHALSDFAWLQAGARDLTAARQNIAEAERRLPRSPWVTQRAFEIEVFYGDPRRAMAMVDDRPEETAWIGGRPRDCLYAYARLRAGLAPSRASVFEACENAGRSLRIRITATLGELDTAFLLAEAMPGEHGHADIMLYYPGMRGFRSDERFWRYADRIGLTDYWRRSGQWPDFCAEDAAAPVCARRLGQS